MIRSSLRSMACVLFGLLIILTAPISFGQVVTGTISVIEGATVIDAVSNSPIQDAVLVISGDKIRSIGKRGSVQIPPDARMINAAGKTIVPGIISLHGHLATDEGMETNIEKYYNRERIQRDANTYLYYGVTHIISLGLDREPILGFLIDQRAGKAGGARVYSAGMGFVSKGGFNPGGYANVNRPTTPKEARELLQKEFQKRPKPDAVKIWVDDRHQGLPKLSPELYAVIIEEAHKNGVKVFAHMVTLDDSKELMRRGVDVLTHSVRDNLIDDEFLTLAREKRVVVTPTLTSHQRSLAYAERASFLDDPGLPPFHPAVVLKTLGSEEFQQKIASDRNFGRTKEEYAAAQKNTAKLLAAGIPIALGTDSGGMGNFQGLWEHREMELLVQAGLTPMQAIQAATINSAKVFQIEKKYGSLEAGKVADFIVLDADPLRNITNSRKIDSVWMNGKQVDRNGLVGQSVAPVSTSELTKTK
jgi:imidazolonepropionase-like amidohydrolase